MSDFDQFEFAPARANGRSTAVKHTRTTIICNRGVARSRGGYLGSHVVRCGHVSFHVMPTPAGVA